MSSKKLNSPQMTKRNHPLVIAHRGFSGKFPENTMLAFQKAIEARADMIEFDVHLTKDKKLIVTHDYQLGRNIKSSGTLSDFSFNELQSMDCGSWFSAKFKNEYPPSLLDVLQLIKKSSIELNIEIKHESLKTPALARHMAKEVLMNCQKLNVVKKVIVSSFYYDVLRELRQLNKTIRIGVLDNSPHQGLKLDVAQELRAYSYHPNFKFLNQEIVRDLHQAGLKIYSYTPLTLKDFQILKKLEVDGLISDHVEKLYNFTQKN